MTSIGNSPNDIATAVDLSEVQADERIRRGIDETPKLFPASSNPDLRHGAGGVALITDCDAIHGQEGFLLTIGGRRALNLCGRVDAFAKRALR
jgi:hypothetical protein